MKKDGEEKKKRIIWAGDFNVNPHADDWSERAFDKIRSKIPKGEKPAGCREKDVQTYNRLLECVDGKNLGEIFTKGGKKKRTCFPNEWYLERDFGQRLDHVVVQKEMLARGEGPWVADFDALQVFGGGRKGCSDHCPLWFVLGRGEKPNTEREEEKHTGEREGGRGERESEKQIGERDVGTRERVCEKQNGERVGENKIGEIEGEKKCTEQEREKEKTQQESEKSKTGEQGEREGERKCTEREKEIKHAEREGEPVYREGEKKREREREREGTEREAVCF